MWRLSETRGAVVVRGGYVPQCSDIRGVERNPAVAWCMAPRMKRSRALRSRRSDTPPRQPRGVWVVFQPRRGVVLPPQPPPFLTSLIFHFSRSLSSSNFCFFSSRFSWWGSVDVRTQSAALACRSVGRVHGAVTSLLLLFLLQEELLQRRRARLHHGARPD